MARTGPVSRRDRPAKPALSQTTIVDAALTILDADGLDAVSMRRVAKALDTGPASLYVYVRNREDLVMLIIDRLAGEIQLPVVDAGTDTPDAWREQLISLMIDSIALLGRHRGIAAAMFGTIPFGPNSLAITECLLALLAQSGISRQARAWAVDVIALYVTAAATEVTIHPEVKEHWVNVPARSAFGALPPDRYPNITDLKQELTYGNSAQRTRWVINALINGILATVPPDIPE